MSKSKVSETPGKSTALGEQAQPIHYERGVLVTLLIWYVAGVFLMFNGDALRDTIGLVVVLVEAVVILVKDRSGLASLYGAIDWGHLSKAQRVGLAIVEVLFFEFALGIYLARLAMSSRDLLPPPPSR